MDVAELVPGIVTAIFPDHCCDIRKHGVTELPATISIVMATYNGARYIGEQLQSILQQMTDDDEIVIIDDCSLDDTIAIIESMKVDTPRVSLYRNEHNLGVKKTFEKGIGYCRGDIIFFSDQDDIWLGGRKQRMLEALESGNCTAILSNSCIMTNENIENTTFFNNGYIPNTHSIWQNFRKNNFIGCCMAFRRDVLRIALPFPQTISMHDWWIGSCAISLGNVAYLAEPTLLYRRHSNNQSSSVRRPWRKVFGDRWGNVWAMLTLLRRRVRR